MVMFMLKLTVRNQGRIGPAAPPPLGRWAPGTTMHFFMNLYDVKHV